MRKILATHSLHLVYDCFTSCFRNPDPGTRLDNKIFCRIAGFPQGLCCGIPLSCLPVVSSSLDPILVLVDGRQLAAGGIFGLGKDLGHLLEVVKLHNNGAEGFERNLTCSFKPFDSQRRNTCLLGKCSSAVSSLQSSLLAVLGHHCHKLFRLFGINI